MAALADPIVSVSRSLLVGLSQKQQAVAAVIAGRMSLLEAAARFRAAGSAPEADGESLCRSVIGWVDLALSDRPERAELVTGLLEQELQSYLARDRHLSVPD